MCGMVSVKSQCHNFFFFFFFPVATWKAAIRGTSLLWKYHSELCSLWTTLLPTVNSPMCISYLLWVTAAATAKLLQSCPTLRPHRWQPTRLCLPWDSPGKNTGVGCHCLLHCVKVKSESEVAQSCLTCSPTDCSLPGSSIHGIFQARVLEWVSSHSFIPHPAYQRIP